MTKKAEPTKKAVTSLNITLSQEVYDKIAALAAVEMRSIPQQFRYLFAKHAEPAIMADAPIDTPPAA